MSTELRLQSMAQLREHAAVPSAFQSDVIYDVRGGALAERRLPAPMRKDYDALEDPIDWLQFDVRNWALIAAFEADQRVGGIIAAMDTDGVDMLEGRRDLVVVWDVRVAPHARGRGLGSSLFRSAEEWARSRGCRELKVETQNVNVAACSLYRANGCTLAQANPGAYPELPDEVQLIWRKPIA